MNHLLKPGRRKQARRKQHTKRKTTAVMLSIAFGVAHCSFPAAFAQEGAPGEQPPECQWGFQADEKAITMFRDSPLADSMRRAHEFATGKGIKVAVIDTGVSAHPRLNNVVGVADLLDGGDPLRDCDGHGTAVAGIIAATPGEDGYTGVAPDATILAIRQTTSLVEDDFGVASKPKGGDLGTMAKAIKIAVDAGADIVNLSLTACENNPFSRDSLNAVMKDAVDYAEAKNALVVAGAGNASMRCKQGDTVYPAHTEGVVSVSAIRDDWRTFNEAGGNTVLPITEWSLRGPNRLVSAPGEPPVALAPGGGGLAEKLVRPKSENPDPNVHSSPYIGTSYAAPVIAGSFALLKELYPNDTPAQLRQRLYDVADPLTGYTDPLSVVTHVNARTGENVGEGSAGQASATGVRAGDKSDQVQVVAQKQRSAPKRAAVVALIILGAALALWWGMGLRPFRLQKATHSAPPPPGPLPTKRHSHAKAEASPQPQPPATTQRRPQQHSIEPTTYVPGAPPSAQHPTHSNSTKQQPPPPPYPGLR